jgi:hypothetical protein
MKDKILFSSDSHLISLCFSFFVKLVLPGHILYVFYTCYAVYALCFFRIAIFNVYIFLVLLGMFVSVNCNPYYKMIHMESITQYEVHYVHSYAHTHKFT